MTNTAQIERDKEGVRDRGAGGEIKSQEIDSFNMHLDVLDVLDVLSWLTLSLSLSPSLARSLSLSLSLFCFSLSPSLFPPPPRPSHIYSLSLSLPLSKAGENRDWIETWGVAEATVWSDHPSHVPHPPPP